MMSSVVDSLRKPLAIRISSVVDWRRTGRPDKEGGSPDDGSTNFAQQQRTILMSTVAIPQRLNFFHWDLDHSWATVMELLDDKFSALYHELSETLKARWSATVLKIARHESHVRSTFRWRLSGAGRGLSRDALFVGTPASGTLVTHRGRPVDRQMTTVHFLWPLYLPPSPALHSRHPSSGSGWAFSRPSLGLRRK